MINRMIDLTETIEVLFEITNNLPSRSGYWKNKISMDTDRWNAILTSIRVLKNYTKLEVELFNLREALKKIVKLRYGYDDELIAEAQNIATSALKVGG